MTALKRFLIFHVEGWGVEGSPLDNLLHTTDTEPEAYHWIMDGSRSGRLSVWGKQIIDSQNIERKIETPSDTMEKRNRELWDLHKSSTPVQPDFLPKEGES